MSHKPTTVLNLFESPRIKGFYHGSEVFYALDGSVELHIHVEHKRQVKPLVLKLTPSAYADLQFVMYRFAEGRGQQQRSMIEKRRAG